MTFRCHLGMCARCILYKGGYGIEILYWVTVINTAAAPFNRLNKLMELKLN